MSAALEVGLGLPHLCNGNGVNWGLLACARVGSAYCHLDGRCLAVRQLNTVGIDAGDRPKEASYPGVRLLNQQSRPGLGPAAQDGGRQQSGYLIPQEACTQAWHVLNVAHIYPQTSVYHTDRVGTTQDYV